MPPNRAQVYMDLADMAEKWKLADASNIGFFVNEKCMIFQKFQLYIPAL